MSTKLPVAAIVLLASVWVALLIASRDPWPSDDGLTVALLLVMGAIGVVVIRKLPRNAVGWLFVATVIVVFADTIARQYLVLDYREHGGRLPLGVVALDVRSGMALTAFLVSLPSILLFPD